jgi:hypothetical protein
MCATCGCGTKVVNQDGNHGTINPYGIGGRDVNAKPVEVKGGK